MQFLRLNIGNIGGQTETLLGSDGVIQCWTTQRIFNDKGRAATIKWKEDGTSILEDEGTNSKGEPIVPAYGRPGRETSC